ncbi:hypothetical protein NECHADRAFT_91804 [Paecilomyces variotii No. 5]|uniref:NAD-dependent 15-hydroxyprostaglandin dehydrogenase n=1 Tax=Byssochlamys spectabilis (strain No. 5 / NBRC 109023) TaxID=1356009 RepID=V5FJF4_BYSSN|nr:hypothetical protein NECHADRAFT_91804 [Paecilomyces variotii No. 5]
MSLAGKHAIITGGGSGINLAFTRKLLHRGCSVLIGDLNLRPEAQELLRQYPSSASTTSPSAIFQKTDVTSWPQLSALFIRGETEWPNIDIVVPGAGIFEPAWSSFWNPPKTPTNPDSPSRDDANGDPGHYTILNVNLTHPIRLGQLAIAHWTTRRIPGSLLVVGSMAGYMYGPGSPLYFASKHGVHAFIRSLGSLRDTLGIRSAAIAPGVVDTPLWDDKQSQVGSKDMAATPGQIADAMLMLLEDPAYGDGTILEATVKGTRVVPAFNAPAPDMSDGGMAEYEAEVERSLIEKLSQGGIRV